MLTVQRVATLEEMRRAEVKSAADQLGERPVEWISVIEVPVEDFVRKNELVLTTAVGCGQDPAQLHDFVREVIDAEAAALVVATGRHVHEVPDAVVQLAEVRAFPIFELPWDVRFADVTRAVLSELMSSGAVLREQSERVQKQLLQLILRGGDLSGIAEVVRQKLHRPVLIVDHHGVIRGKSHRSDALVRQWQLVAEAAPPAQERLLELPIRSAREIQGSLIVPPPDGEANEWYVGQERSHVLEHAATAAALWFLRENAVQETELRMRDDFVWSLAKGELDEWDDVLARARSLGYDVSCPYVCLLGFPENLHAIAAQHTDHAAYQGRAEAMQRSVEERIVQSAASLDRHLLWTYPRDEFVLFLEVRPASVAQDAALFVDAVESRIKEAFPDLVMSWGIGEYHTGPMTFYDSFQDARVALDIGRRQRGPGSRTTYAETGIFRALLRLSKDSEVQEITLTTIGALSDYGDRKHVDLIGTIAAYCRNHGNVSRTAKELNLHRQSLLYRLKKIESLTGRSLFHPDDRFLLDLSVRLWSMGLSQADG